MKRNYHFNRLIGGIAALFVTITSAFNQVSAAALDISKTPLFSGGGVQPNVLFLIDDSGSMRFGLMKSDGALDEPKLAGMNDKALGGIDNELVLSKNDTEKGYEFLMMCPGVNVLAFDPSKTYEPWYGMPESTYTDALRFPTGTDKKDFSQYDYKYVEWIDGNNNNRYDFGECGELSFTNTVNGAQVDEVHFQSSRLKLIADLTDVQKKNFANWFTYYRTRDYVLKAALSNVLVGLKTRAGLATINANSAKGWGMNIVNVDDISDPSSQTIKDNKAKLIKTLYSVNTDDFNGGTPLRFALENAGLYYMVGSNTAPAAVPSGFVPDPSVSPMLPENQGGSCQQNHTILVTDGYQHEWGLRPNLTYGNADKTSAWGGGYYADELSNTLADIAMYFFSTDARPDYADDVNVKNAPGDLSVDTNSAQHMITHTLSFGVVGNIEGFPDPNATPAWGTNGQNWPASVNPEVESPESLDDVIHAAYNGRGEYLTAKDSKGLQDAFDELINSIYKSSESGTSASVGFNSTSISSDSLLFQGQFFMEDWSGKLIAYQYASGSVGAVVWDASKKLVGRDPTNQRNIVTFNGVKGVPFRNLPANLTTPDTANGELSAAQVQDLFTGMPTGVDQSQYGQDIIEYLRGDGDGAYQVATDFRTRASKLGDIVNSSPQFVGVPNALYPNSLETTPYSSFISAQASRTPMVYVGANDGMLHGFNANTGEEEFAYIPKAVFSSANEAGLHWLADKNYTHVPYVDATPSIADVYVNNKWQTYLVGGLGRGGKAIYVLNVTDPANKGENTIASNVVIDEFTDTNLGYTFSRPQIAKMEDGEWVAVFGNGYGNDMDGQAYLYVLYLDGSGPGGKKYERIGPLGGGNIGSVANNRCEDVASDCNGLSSPTLLDIDNNGKLDRVYAGDLHGNLWAFDFTQFSGSHVEPVVAHTSSGKGVPLFTACSGSKPNSGYCAATNRQPITTKPIVVAHGSKRGATTEPNLFVVFGTGQYLTESDLSDTKSQALYGVWDAGCSGGTCNSELRTNDLTEQTISNVTTNTRDFSDTKVVYNTSGAQKNFGWYMTLPASGERMMLSPLVAEDVVIFTSVIPTTDICSRGGSGYLMAVDLFSGGKTPFHVFPNKTADGFAINTAGGLARIDDTLVRTNTTDENDLQIERIVTEPKRAPRRVSWSVLK